MSYQSSELAALSQEKAKDFMGKFRDVAAGIQARERRDKLAARLANDYTYHAPKGDQATRYTQIRAAAGELAELIANLTPESREQSVAFTKLDEVVFWANASIARNE